MSLLKKIQDKYRVIHEIGDSRVDAFETELTGGEHNVPYSPAVLSKTNAIEQKIDDHTSNMANPHKVTKEQLGLANVENKSSSQIRSEITKENVTNALGYTPVDESKVGAANGVASLDPSGRIPASQIPGGFDNIKEDISYIGFALISIVINAVRRKDIRRERYQPDLQMDRYAVRRDFSVSGAGRDFQVCLSRRQGKDSL